MKDEINIEEIQDKYLKMNEYIMLGFRKKEGISSSEFKKTFSEDIFSLFGDKLEKLKKLSLIEINNKKEESDFVISLSEKGLDLANIVFEEFIP